MVTVAGIRKYRIFCIVIKEVGREERVSLAPVTMKAIAPLFGHEEHIAISFGGCQICLSPQEPVEL